ncbi:DoxX family membrane protein [Tamlana fucoidanivorans]|uniref:DoxX family membrane protein n=1 Tax=Allotamlana fucoidanivorans TaxID=2583814 RepID=A0A5C4SQ99_9FLAO|nr:BT_3928 family protein [Tamlana fucoidanivorans]TNJ45656.1 DoxX family membrane protein [Tamlana fucoidanivorans]
MKVLVAVSRLFVGVLFIISGFIKLNDPLGFSYKLQEYFSPDVLNIPFLEPYALGISVLVVVFEVVLGAFLLVGYKPKFTVWSLLLMILFFTFLTFYSAYFDKVKDCGCFGDALKLTPWESFTKDVVLLVFILILFVGVKYIQPVFGKLQTTSLALLSFIVSLWFGYHVLEHLPWIDFRAYKIGANIAEGMKVPEDAAKPVLEYTWTFNVNGKEQDIVTDGSYPSVEGDFVSVDTKVIEEGYTPPVVDFSIEFDDEDLTEYFLSQEHVILVISYNLDKIEKNGALKLKNLQDDALKMGYSIIGLTASGAEAKQRINEAYNLDFSWYLCDEKALKTVVRSNPGVLVLDKGTVKQKVHWNDIETLELPATFSNLKLKSKLDTIFSLDQKYRDTWENYDKNFKEQSELDSLNLIDVEKIIKEFGYPGKTLVGDKTSSVAFYVIQHSNKIEDYLPTLEKAAKMGQLDFVKFAMAKDRYLMSIGKEQIYGTQGTVLNQNSAPTNIIWPIKNVSLVDSLRFVAGFKSTVEQNGKKLFGSNFKFEAFTLSDIKTQEKDNPWLMELLKDVE